MESLLVVVPTRSRRANCERMLEAFRETAKGRTDILFVTDPDDQDTYEGVDWGDAFCGVMEPRGSYISKLNHGAHAFAGTYDAYMAAGDSNVFITPGWDSLLLGHLASMGSGWVYPENKRRNDIPEMWVTSADLISLLGWFAPPEVGMYYGDNIVMDLGRRAEMIRFCPDVVIEHRHYTVDRSVTWDETYRDAEETWGKRDLEAYQKWAAEKMPLQVARLRREFHPDLKWLMGRF